MGYMNSASGGSGGDTAITSDGSTPSLASGITEGEVKALLNLENADIVAAVEGETGSVDFTGDITIAAGKKLTARRLNTISIDGDTTLSESTHAGRYIFVADSNDGAKPVITLPENAGAGVRFIIVGAHEFGIARSGSDTLNGGTASIDVPQHQTATCVSDGSNYFVSVVSDPVYLISKITDNTNSATLTAGGFRKVEFWDNVSKNGIGLDSDSDGSKFTVPAGLGGLYRVDVQVGWVSSNSTLPSSASSFYQLAIAIYKDGSVLVRQGIATPGSPSAKTQAISTEIALDVGEELEIYVFVRKEDDPGNSGTQQLRGGEYGRWAIRRVGDS